MQSPIFGSGQRTSLLVSAGYLPVYDEVRIRHHTCILIIAGAGFVIFLSATFTQHLAFRTSTHDFWLFKEILENAFAGEFLNSTVLGRSFLSEHFSPILFVLAPFAQVFKTPYFLLAVHALALWSAVFLLPPIGRRMKLDTAVTNLFCIVYLCHPIMVRTLNYPFHIEVFYPLVFFGLFLAYKARRFTALFALAVLAAGIKEDAGLYLFGFGLFFATKREWRLALPLCFFGLGTTAATVFWAIPALSPHDAGYPFLSRWSEWGAFLGAPPAESTVGMWPLLSRLVNKYVIQAFACLLFLPLASLSSFFLVSAPWLLNATSSTLNQAHFHLYYGLPFLSLGLLGALENVGRFQRKAQARPRVAAFLATLVVILNLAHFTFPEIPRCRRTVLATIKEIPPSASVAAMPCFFPAVGEERNLSRIWPGEDPRTDFMILRREETTWPFTEAEAAVIIDQLQADSAYKIWFECDDFCIFARSEMHVPLAGGT